MNAHSQEEDAPAALGVGLCTPLGLTAQATQAEMAAGTVRFFETDVLAKDNEPVRASVLSLLDAGLSRTERMASLAATALDGLMPQVASLQMEQIPLYLALPEPGSGSPFDVGVVLEALARIATPVRITVSGDFLFPEGRAGFFRALAKAYSLLISHKDTAVLIGGIDSMCDRGSLAHHAHTERSLGANTQDGILPGEGAGFLLLCSSKTCRRLQLSPQAWVLGSSLAQEPHSFLRQQPSIGIGLTDAFEHLQRHPIAGNRRVDHVFSCQTGEVFWAKEFNYSYLRNALLMPEPLTVNLVAESLGDVGAAAGVIQFGNALHQLSGQSIMDNEAPRALLYGCSDAGHVGACVIKLRK